MAMPVIMPCGAMSVMPMAVAMLMVRREVVPVVVIMSRVVPRDTRVLMPVIVDTVVLAGMVRIVCAIMSAMDVRRAAVGRLGHGVYPTANG